MCQPTAAGGNPPASAHPGVSRNMLYLLITARAALIIVFVLAVVTATPRGGRPSGFAGGVVGGRRMLCRPYIWTVRGKGAADATSDLGRADRAGVGRGGRAG